MRGLPCFFMTERFDTTHHKRFRVVILAAGKGTRMKNNDLPKALTPFRGKPMISNLLDTIARSGIDEKPVVVVGFQAEKIRAVLGDRVLYVEQTTQRGTGDAVRCAQELLEPTADVVVVLYSDHPLVHASTLKKLRFLHEREGRVVTMMTTTVQDFEDWRRPFYDFGRILRNAGDEVVGIVEKKDATPSQLSIRELNPALFCFDAKWLWEYLPKIQNQNAQGEYYLTDLIHMAIQGGFRIASMNIDPLESIGVNTPEHLALAESVL